MTYGENAELHLARRIIESTGTHLFLTGKAGTGKTTFLRHIRTECPKRMVVLAPTGIAAINAGGMTIHSFFQLPFAPYVPSSSFAADGKAAYRFRFGKEKINIIRSMDLLVIDEISMVRADLLDAVDSVMRRYRDHSKPFGGVQLLMIGDLCQLAPVVKDDEWTILEKYYDTPYFFSSTALRSTDFCTIELKTVYRQSDNRFVQLLNCIRENKMTADVLTSLNSRFIPNFRPAKNDGYIRLVTHNNQAHRINAEELAQLPGTPTTFNAEIEGKFPEYSYPTDLHLQLKRGAQVMFVKNDSSGEQRYCNGTIGEVTALSPTHIEVRCKDSHDIVTVKPEEWTNARYVLDDKSNEIQEEIEGTFKQYPLRTAWAITIHKSQGLTFEHAIIDAGNAFAHGQTYVALSRCKTLKGLVLGTPLSEKAVISDDKVTAFTREALSTTPDNEQLDSMQRAFYIEMLCVLFDFSKTEQALRRLTRIVDEHLYRLYPKQLTALKTETMRFKEKVTDVATRFAMQYTRLAGTSEQYADDTAIQKRIHAGAEYFSEQIAPTVELLGKTSLDTDNKEVKKRLKDAMEELASYLFEKTELLSFVHENGFNTTDFMKQKALLSISGNETANSGKSARKKKSTEKAAGNLPSASRDEDMESPDLYKSLVAWRKTEASSLGIPAYMVMQQKAIIGICKYLPKDTATLSRIPYIGKKGVEKYGEIILEMVLRHTANDK